ncbi:MAG TPA: C40 family peptidase, partial [candidate division Zixibacteria bacterium]|nr:C40 family peptidase [candidate division Zixibacteria bacterium]
DERGAPVKPYFLPYGSIVFPTESGDNGAERIEIAAPDKIRRWVQRDDLTDVVDPAEETTADLQESIILSAVQFLGVPYLWGGRSPMGFDCSGLVQIIYGMHGINLPRDSAEQRLVGREVSRGQLAPGDLIYSPGHVVIYMEADRFIHASLGEGGVEINSYDPHDENYREDLDRDFAVARRVVGETLSD